jgi:hypothetical protein
VQIRKIAAATTGDEDLPARLSVVFQQCHAPSALTRNRGAHQSGRARAQNNHIELARILRHGLCSE